ncbi:hypothetical protein RA279_29530, partial [Pseudomonas syringae pv. tagetis]
AIVPQSINAVLRWLMERLQTFLSLRRQEWWPVTDRFAFLHSPSPLIATPESQAARGRLIWEGGEGERGGVGWGGGGGMGG